jgi:hypothetical protein
MLKELSYFALIFAFACSADPKTILNSTTPDSTITAKGNHTSADSANTDEDCVFDNNFKGLTTKWLSELKITDFIWREDLHGALIPQGQDTVFVSQGGCGHFGISVEIWMRTSTPDITDSTFWISKALELADKYQMNDYSEIIRKGKLRKINMDEINVWYEVSPENQAGNEIFDGIAVVCEKDFKRLSFGKYFN